MADFTGTSGDDLIFFDGIEEELDFTLTNAYTGETFFISDIYNVNMSTYNGLTGTDTLLMTNVGDALFILNEMNQQTIFSIERIVAGDGGDIINLASTSVTLGDTFIDGGLADDILWGNSGNDTIQGAAGNDRIDGGPGNDILRGQDGDDNVKGGAGNDTITGGNNDDTLDGNAGNDNLNGDAGNDALVYTQSENVGSTDIYNGGAGSDTLVLRLTAAQANADAADIAAAQAFMAANLNTASSTGPSYSFSSFGLTVSNIESITVVITSNTNPVAQDDDFTGTRDQVVAGNVLANNGHGTDSDADGDTLSVQATTLTTAAGGHVVLNSDGTFTYTGATGFTGVDSFNYTLLDTHGGSDTGAVTLTINPPPNQNPVAHNDDFSGQENQPVTGNLLADNGHGADSDPDGNTINAIAGTFTSANGGTVAVNADGTFTYTPASNYIGADSFTYTLVDGQGGSATGTVNLTINDTAPANHNPVAQDDIFSTAQGHAVAGNVLLDNGNGVDSDSDGDALGVLAAMITTAGGGHVDLHTDGSFTYTPAVGYTGADTFNYTLFDGNGGQDSGSVALSVGTITTHPHEFSDANVLFPAVIEGTNIAYLIPPGTPALGVLHGELDIGNAATATITFEQSVAGYHNSLGAFVIDADGTIENVHVLFKDAHQQSVGDQFNVALPANQGAQLGFFIISDGGSSNPSLNGMIHSTGTFHFYYDYGQGDQRLANVDDDGTHISLVYTNNGGHDTVLHGADYFTTERGGDTSLNPDDATHVVSGLASANDTSQLRFSFEDLPNTGDADYNDLIFSVSINSTFQTTTDAYGDTAFIGSAGLFGAMPETFLIDAINSAPEKIVDFKGGTGGDTLDITNILQGYDSLSSLFANFVQATTNGGNTTIAVNSDGHTGGTFIPVAVLENVSFTLADLVTDGNLIAA